MRSATARERTRHTALLHAPGKWDQTIYHHTHLGPRKANALRTTVRHPCPPGPRPPRAPRRPAPPPLPFSPGYGLAPVCRPVPSVRGPAPLVHRPTPPRQPALSVNPKFPAVTDRAARMSGTTRERSAPGPGSRSVSASRSESYGAAGRASKAGCCRAATVGAPRYENATGRPAKGRERHPTRARAAAPPSAPTARVPSWAPPRAPPYRVRRPCALPCAGDFPYGCPPHRRPARVRRRAVRPNPRAWAVPRRSRPCSRSATRSGRTRRPRRRRAGSGPVR